MFKILVIAIILIVVVGFIVLTYKNSPFSAKPSPEEDVPPHEEVEQQRKPSRESGVSATLKYGKKKYGTNN